MLDKDIVSSLRTFATSRRHFLQATTIAGTLVATTTLAPSSIAGIALAESAAVSSGDLGILNFALTLEHFENALYRALLASGLLSGQALSFARTFGAHESTHVTALTQTIMKLGGTPVQEQAAYNFPKVTTQAQVIAALSTVEDVGASAYLGAAPLVQDAGLLTVAVEIHSVEAEHATGWRFLNGQDPVPFAFAPPRTKQEVLDVVTPFLTVPSSSMPATMPNTGLSTNGGLKVIGAVGGIAAVAAGAALLRGQRSGVAEQE